MKKIYIILIFLLILNSCNKEEKIVSKTNDVKPKIQKEINQNITQIKYKTWETISSGNTLSWIDIKTNMGIENLINTKTIIKNTTQKEINKIWDDSITKFVNDKVHFSKLNYSPKDLVYLKWDYIIDAKWNQVLRNEANKYLQELSKDFYKEFSVRLKVVSAYRSYNYQVWIKQRWCSDMFCAKPGYSEHQSWLAVDFFETTSKDEFLAKKELKKYFDWLEKNAYKYWFHNSYKNWKEIDWYAIEPWHWRYLWVPFATELQQENITYAEYYLKHWEK